MSIESIVEIAPRNATGAVRRKIGTILVDSGILTEENCAHVLKFMLSDKKLRFGEAAIQLGLVKALHVQKALSQQFCYTYLPSSSKPVSDEILVAYQPFDLFAEEVRAICSELLQRWFDSASRQKTLAVLSMMRGDGRSFIAANLAVVFSQFGRRTLLIDADLREPRQHELFNLDNQRGLSNLLEDGIEQDTIVSIKAFGNLDVLPAGPTPDDSLELLSRPVFNAILSRWRSTYDVILFDTPAVSGCPDAKLLAIRAMAALMVARTNRTRIGPFGDTAEILRRSGCTVLGSVLNEPLLHIGQRY